MSNPLKKLAGQTALYGLSSIVGRTVNFLLVPVLTHLLLPPEFGVITYLYAYTSFLNIIYLYGLETGYFRFAKKEEVGENNAFSVSFSSILVSTVLFSSVFILFSEPIAQLVLHQQKSGYIVLLAIILATDSLAALPFARMRWKGQALQFALLKLSSIILNIGLTLFFLKAIPGFSSDDSVYSLVDLYLSEDKVTNILLANLLANIFPFLFFKNVIKGFIFTLRKDIRKSLIAYCIPLMWMGLAGMVNEVMSRILLEYILPDNFYPGQSKLHAIGVFGACYKLSMFMTLAIQAFRYAADPFFFSKASDKNAPALFAKIMTWFVISCLPIFILVSIFLPYFGLLLRNPAYREGLLIVPYLLLANLFLGIYYNLSMWYKLTDKTIYGTYLSILGAIITFVGNFLLIPVMGYFGSALITLVCYLCMALLSWYFGQKYYPIPYQLVKISLYILFAVGLVVLSSLIQTDSALSDLAFRSLLLLIYPIVVYLFEIRKISAKLS
ncbi:MAG: polysaccharide biosynthesis C-terminal domain-containing protein [Cytophagaceae bacterium]|nr:polysaccharide biosynthesis C-terminal domain-containing protein [Cytophagaceae bacterium]